MNGAELAKHYVNDIGVPWLDASDPAWWSRIDLHKLSLYLDSDCIFGQLYGSYERAMSWLMLERTDAIRMGLVGHSGQPFSVREYHGLPLAPTEALTQCWRDAIVARRVDAPPPASAVEGVYAVV